jgi:hypothetical protein
VVIKKILKKNIKNTDPSTTKNKAIGIIIKELNILF